MRFHQHDLLFVSSIFATRNTTAVPDCSSLGYLLLAEVKDLSFSGAKDDLADVTNFESGNFREWLTTLADSGELSFSANYIPADPSQQLLLGFFNIGELVEWKIVLPAAANGGPIYFNAYVSSLEHNLPLDKEAMLSVKLKITGQVSGF